MLSGLQRAAVKAMTEGPSEISMAQVATENELPGLENRLFIRICGSFAAMLTVVAAILKLL